VAVVVAVGYLIPPVETVDLVVVVVVVVVVAVLLEQQELLTQVVVVDHVLQVSVAQQTLPVVQELSLSDMQCQRLQSQHHLLD
jgi:hypothetical protein